jgi:hypothetical protein
MIVLCSIPHLLEPLFPCLTTQQPLEMGVFFNRSLGNVGPTRLQNLKDAARKQHTAYLLHGPV